MTYRRVALCAILVTALAVFWTQSTVPLNAEPHTPERAAALSDAQTTQPAEAIPGVQGEPAVANHQATAATIPAAQDADWVATATEQIRAREYWVSENQNGIQAPNRRHGIRTYFSPEGIQIESRIGGAGEPLVKLTYAGLSRGDQGDAVGANAAINFDKDRVELLHGDGVVEWFVNRPAGVEQGFTIPSRPDGSGEVQVAIDVAHSAATTSGEEIWFESSDNRTLRYAKLLVEDADGVTLESSMSVNDAGQIVLAYADTDARYPVVVDPVITGDHDVRLRGDQKRGYFGVSMANAGDINGDGFTDVIIGADFYDGGETNEGAVFVFHGTNEGLDREPTKRLEIDAEGAQLGNSMDSAGDVNGDGFGDIIVGARRLNDTGFDQGAAFVWYGSPTGLSDLPDWGVLGLNAHDLLGTVVVGVGDLDGDGFDEVGIGAPGVDVEEQVEIVTEDSTVRIVTEIRRNAGTALFYHGSGAGLPSVATRAIVGAEDYDEVGTDIAGPGDIDNDGYDDLLLGVPGYDEGDTEDVGKAVMYLGSSIGIGTAPQWSIVGVNTDEEFGFNVAGIGDVNADGFADIAVARKKGDDNLPSVFVYYGKPFGLDTFRDVELLSLQVHPIFPADLEFGRSVENVGDVNGDGYDDTAVGIPLHRDFDPALGPTNPSGAVAVYLGSADGLDSGNFLLLKSTEEGAGFGVSAAGLGDINQDGFDDMAVGASAHDHSDILSTLNPPLLDSGGVFIFNGSAFGVNPSHADRLFLPPGFEELVISSAGDLNGDGYPDLFVGAPGYDAGAPGDGAFTIYRGNSRGLDLIYGLLVPGQGGSAFNFGLGQGVGDIDNDGYDDLVIGVLKYSNGQSEEGAVYVYFGHPVDIVGFNSPTIIESNIAGAWLGGTVTAAGDSNGDDFMDFAASASFYTNGEQDEGAIYFFLGQNGGVNPTPSIVESNIANANLGFFMTGGGDINNDGFDEVVYTQKTIGSPAFSDPNREFVNINYGGPVGGVDRIYTNSLVGALEIAGDLNGDGYDDLAIGASNVGNIGSVDFYTGREGPGTPGSIISIGIGLQGNEFADGFGSVIAGAGDINGDGLDDLLVSTPSFTGQFLGQGAITAYYGAVSPFFGPVNPAPAWQAIGDTVGAQLGQDLVVTSRDAADKREVVALIGSPRVPIVYEILVDQISNYVDDDGDGFPDQLEAQFGLDRTDPYDGQYDRDQDGLSNALEYELGTDIDNPDTDGDGSSDAVEYYYGPLIGGLGPLVADVDSDGDGLFDLGELALTTDPGNPDTDGDGLPDGYEVAQDLRVGFVGVVPFFLVMNPLIADSGNDLDGDGFTNLEEYLAGTDPLDFNSFPPPGGGAFTDATGFADTTGDGIPDFASFVSDEGMQPKAKILSGADGSLFDTHNFLNPNWTGIAIDTVDDANGDGTADDPGVAMLLIETGSDKLLVQVRDAATGANINKINFLNPDWAPVDVVVFNDVNGDGNADDAAIGVLAENRTTGKILVQIRDLDTGAKIATRSFLNPNWRAIGAAAASRAGQPPALGILGVENGTGKILVQTRQLSDGVLIDNAKYLSSDWQAQDIVHVNDGNSDGVANDPGWLVLANNAISGNVLVQGRDLATGSRLDNINYLTTAYEGQRLASSPDISGNGREEAGVLGCRVSDNQHLLQIRDFDDETRTLNIFP